MKKYLLILSIALIMSCGSYPDPAYHPGDRVYILPDSVEGIVVRIYDKVHPTYVVNYFDSLKVSRGSLFEEFELVKKK